MSKFLSVIPLAATVKPNAERTMEYIKENCVFTVNHLEKLNVFMDNPTAAPLSTYILEADPDTFNNYLESTLSTFQYTILEPFVDSFDSADVTRMEIGTSRHSIMLYLAGGMTEGTPPSKTYELWNRVLGTENPLADLIHSACFIHLNQPFLPPEESDVLFVEAVGLGKVTKVTPPF